MHILFHPPHNSSIIRQEIMGLEDIYNTTNLTLSLGSDDHHQNMRSKPSPISSSDNNNNYLSSLSLGLPWELKFEVVNDNNGSTEMTMMMNSSQASPAAAPSSFSDSSLKREREISGDEDDLEGDEKGSPRDDVYQDDEGVGTRKKLRLTKEQSVVLEESFKDHTTLNSKQKQELARRLNLRPRQVEVWFQNRRARTKLKQTEVEYEVLRKCYETLADENRRLQMELQELKAANQATTAPPPPLQMAAATLTMCPSCERTYGGGASGDNSSAKFSLSAGEKSQFYRSFLNPSAAC